MRPTKGKININTNDYVHKFDLIRLKYPLIPITHIDEVPKYVYIQFFVNNGFSQRFSRSANNNQILMKKVCLHTTYVKNFITQFQNLY